MKKKKAYIYLAAYLLCMACFFRYQDKEETDAPVQVEERESSQQELKKKVALTFDDGPSIYTEQLLDGMEERKVCATFFVVGENAEKFPQTIQRMYANGNLIGNHTYSHIQLNAVQCDFALEEVRKTNAVIKTLTGEEPSYLRPPYGECCQKVKDTFDMVNVLWDVDPLDWCSNDSRLVAEKILKNVKENDIILLHDIYESSVEAAFLVMDTLQKENYEFVTVEELFFP